MLKNGEHTIAKSDDWSVYLVSFDSVEEGRGSDFMSLLDAGEEERIEWKPATLWN